MAEENKKVEETKVEEPKKPEVTKVDLKKKANELKSNITKIDLTNPQNVNNDEVEKQPVDEDVVVVNPEPEKQEVKEDVDETPIVQDVTNEPPSINVPKVEIPKEVKYELPEKLQKVANFMNETGGNLNDYVNLNRDISKMDDSDVLDEYYRDTKSHLTNEERNFLLEEKFGFNEDEDDSKEVRKKKIALKEQVAEAKAHLDGQKSKYYEEIKGGVNLTDKQIEAINFYNEYQKDSAKKDQATKLNKSTFLKKTEDVFNEDFKGFDYQIGDKKFRINVKDVDNVKTEQSDLNNFIHKFANEDKSAIEDASGYHKSLFTAMNADNIAKHFYEQGKADAIKDTVAKDKNISLDPRQIHGEVSANGMRVRALGESADDFKFKIKRKK
jgi:hypothetical protein